MPGTSSPPIYTIAYPSAGYKLCRHATPLVCRDISHKAFIVGCFFLAYQTSDGCSLSWTTDYLQSCEWTIKWTWSAFCTYVYRYMYLSVFPNPGISQPQTRCQHFHIVSSLLFSSPLFSSLFLSAALALLCIVASFLSFIRAGASHHTGHHRLTYQK